MLSRRQFVMSPLAAGTTFAAGASLAQVNKRTIVDAQMHLWKAESEDWKWPSGMQPQLPEPFTIERLLPLMNEAGVDRAIIARQPGWGIETITPLRRRAATRHRCYPNGESIRACSECQRVRHPLHELSFLSERSRATSATELDLNRNPIVHAQMDKP